MSSMNYIANCDTPKKFVNEIGINLILTQLGVDVFVIKSFSSNSLVHCRSN